MRKHKKKNQHFSKQTRVQKPKQDRSEKANDPVTCSSHITTTVWLSDRHLSLLTRRHPGQRQPPGRLQSRSLRQHGRPADALPTGRLPPPQRVAEPEERNETAATGS